MPDPCILFYVILYREVPKKHYLTKANTSSNPPSFPLFLLLLFVLPVPALSRIVLATVIAPQLDAARRLLVKILKSETCVLDISSVFGIVDHRQSIRRTPNKTKLVSNRAWFAVFSNSLDKTLN